MKRLLLILLLCAGCASQKETGIMIGKCSFREENTPVNGTIEMSIVHSENCKNHAKKKAILREQSRRAVDRIEGRK